MDLESYNERVNYLRSSALPSHMDARQRYRFKQAMKRYSSDHCLRLLFNSRRVHDEGKVDQELKLFHEELGHCNRDDFIGAVRARYSIVGLEGRCRNLVTTCVARLDDLIGCRLDGPMIPYPEGRRKALCCARRWVSLGCAISHLGPPLSRRNQVPSRHAGHPVHSQLRLLGVECRSVWDARPCKYFGGCCSPGAYWTSRATDGPLRWRPPGGRR